MFKGLLAPVQEVYNGGRQVDNSRVCAMVDAQVLH